MDQTLLNLTKIASSLSLTRVSCNKLYAPLQCLNMFASQFDVLSALLVVLLNFVGVCPITMSQCVSLYYFFICHRPAVLEAVSRKRALWLLHMSIAENQRDLLQ